jgi:hypothetical protein
MATVSVYEYSNEFAAGQVIRTDPPAGTVVDPDDTITLYISLGPTGWFEDSVNANEAEKIRYAMFLAVNMNFPSGEVRVWSGIGQITLFDEVYTGLGLLGRASSAPERNNLTFERKTYQLTGVDPSLVSEEDIEDSFGRSVVEYLGFLTEDGVLVADPEVNFEGEISNIRRVDGR